MVNSFATTKGISSQWYVEDKQIHSIQFFDDKGNVIKFRNSWLELQYEMKDGSWNEADRINFMKLPEVKIKKKIDLTLKHSFLVKSDKYDSYDKRWEYDLYIYIDGTKVALNKVKTSKRDSDMEKYIYHYTYDVYELGGTDIEYHRRSSRFESIKSEDLFFVVTDVEVENTPLYYQIEDIQKYIKQERDKSRTYYRDDEDTIRTLIQLGLVNMSKLDIIRNSL